MKLDVRQGASNKSSASWREIPSGVWALGFVSLMMDASSESTHSLLLPGDHFVSVFWIAVIPAFLAFALIVVAVHEPERAAGLRQVRMPLGPLELRRLDAAYWWVVTVATVFTFARFSEAFLLLRAQSVGLPLMLVPVVLVIMNIAYAFSAYPVGALSDRIDRTTILLVGLFVLLVADLILAFAAGVMAVLLGAMLWGLHMGFTQGLLAALVADTAPAELRGTA